MEQELEKATAELEKAIASQNLEQIIIKELLVSRLMAIQQAESLAKLSEKIDKLLNNKKPFWKIW